MQIEDFPANNLKTTIQPGFLLLEKEMVGRIGADIIWVKALIVSTRQVLAGRICREEENLLVAKKGANCLEHEVVGIGIIDAIMLP
ncbi:MAG: hypothetical protein WC835_03670 [Candidatus Paceibacterota bacterium]|jgi:hypothetical protein